MTRDRINILSARAAVLLMIASFLASISSHWIPVMRSACWWLLAAAVVFAVVNVATLGGAADDDQATMPDA